MKQLILLIAILLTSTVVLAEDTTTEICANGAGIVITGAVSGHKYCLSKTNVNMSWWNAWAWCDGQGRRLFHLNDCEYEVTNATTTCPELKSVLPINYTVWTASPKDTTKSYCLYSTGASIQSGERANISNGYNELALCY